MNPPSLRKLQHALVLAEALNYAAAAKKLHLTQSALTRSIQSLETELGFRLFDRNLSGVKVTPDGKLLLARAQTLMIHVNSFSHEVSAMQRIDSGRTALGFGAGTQCLFLPALLVDICHQYPGMSVSIEIESAERLLSMLKEEQLEFIVVDSLHLDVDDNGILETENLVTLPFRVYGRKNHPLTRLDLPKEELQALSLRYPQISVQFDPALDPWRKLTIDENLPLIQCNDLHSLGQVVSCSDGLWIGIEAMVKEFLADGSIELMPVEPPISQKQTAVSLIKLKQRTLSMSSSAVVDWIRNDLLISGIR